MTRYYGTPAQFARAAASYDSREPQDDPEVLDSLQERLLQIPAFVLEAEDTADFTLRQKLHLYASCGDKAAYLSLVQQIGNEYAETLFEKTVREFHGREQDSADYLIQMYSTEQKYMEKSV